jgi:hypothetical protein
MNVEIRTEAAQLLEKEYINWIFVTVCCPLTVDQEQENKTPLLQRC